MGAEDKDPALWFDEVDVFVVGTARVVAAVASGRLAFGVEDGFVSEKMDWADSGRAGRFLAASLLCAAIASLIEGRVRTDGVLCDNAGRDVLEVAI